MTEEPKDERVEDLDVPEAASDDVKGGAKFEPYLRLELEEGEPEPGLAAKLPGKRIPPT